MTWQLPGWMNKWRGGWMMAGYLEWGENIIKFLPEKEKAAGMSHGLY